QFRRGGSGVLGAGRGAPDDAALCVLPFPLRGVPPERAAGRLGRNHRVRHQVVGIKPSSPYASAFAARTLPVTGDTLDHATAARVEVIIEANTRAARPRQKTGKVAGDERLAARPAARAVRAGRAARERAVDEAGRAAQGVYGTAKARLEPGERKLRRGEIDADR